MTPKLSLLFALMLSTLIANAHDIEVQNADGKIIYYNYYNNGTELEVTFRGDKYDTYSNEYEGNVIIPEEVTFMNRTRSVTSIGLNAFGDCKGVTEITVPNSVREIGDYAFFECSGLTKITIPNSVTEIGSSAFFLCKGLTSIVIPNRMKKISKSVFYGCSGLTSITIPNSVASIESNAFECCSNLKTINISNSVKEIGMSAFSGCNGLAEVHITDIAAWCNIIFSSNGNPLSYAKHLYMNGKEIIDLVIPSGVTSIGNGTFSKCSSFTSVTIPNSVTSIGSSAFSGCSGLTSVTIPNSVTSIGGGTFSGCSGLTSVTIGNFVTSIGQSAFYQCSNLKSVIIPNSVTEIGDHAFGFCSGLTSVTIGNSVETIGWCAFEVCTSLTSITVPNSVISIKGRAFQGCSSLTSVTIGSGVTSIEQNAFYGADISNVVSLIKKPFTIEGKASNYKYTFSQNTFNNATLYVPVGTIEMYKATDGWKDFFFIEEGDGPGGDTPPIPETKKCEKPAINCVNGKLLFLCKTEDVRFIYTIIPPLTTTGEGDKIDLSTTYIVKVYATKVGYEDSEIATKEIDLGTSGIRGDLNGDGVVNMPDAMFIVNKILNGKFPDE